MPLNCLMGGAQSPQACTKSSKLKGTLSLREALLGLKASEGTSVWMFRGFLLTPGGNFSAAVERPFRVFCELLFFLIGLVPSLVCHSDNILQGDATDSNSGSAESGKGESSHRKMHLHSAL